MLQWPPILAKVQPHQLDASKLREVELWDWVEPSKLRRLNFGIGWSQANCGRLNFGIGWSQANCGRLNFGIEWIQANCGRLKFEIGWSQANCGRLNFGIGLWKMAISKPKSAHLREVLLFAFNWKKSATEAHRMLEEVYSDHALSKSQCYRWFKKFQSGDF
ncbi:hypothetical protein LAZ67_15002038 [Cordylochernes scorpioides]|uniref:Mos1 transposase HTH domain-containing protein n=1 Tax=Cordylochernes scorpioides TaxID=51811 RepID=A0ABY6LBX0_9ARAC|nr:hypothetical protein LAZ67_15002038 [Cordylochernes scorpioides]